MTKSIEENPQYNNERAQKMLRRAVERDPKTIRAKAEVMLDHFDAKIYRNHKLMGQAKAMVVTKDIECAIIYYNALQVKYAYAVTCHKAQGGQWEHVYIDQGYITEEMLTDILNSIVGEE